MELNPHIPKPEPPVEEKEEEKKEAEEAADDNKKEEDKEKVITMQICKFSIILHQNDTCKILNWKLDFIGKTKYRYRKWD